MPVALILAVAILAMAVNSFSCSARVTQTEPIVIGSAPLESSALVYIAEAKGFFAKNRLSVAIKEYETGAAAHNALLKGEVDIAILAEYPLVGSALKKEAVSAIASIAKAQYFFLVGRKDRGIESIPDIRGKKIGLVQKTIAEFYLGRFLILNGIGTDKVTMVNMNYPQSEDAIVNGAVDAAVSRPPYVISILERLGDRAGTWPVQSSQALYAVVTARNDWIAGHPELVSRLLKSLDRAEEYLTRNPAESKAIVQKRLNFTGPYMTAVWSQNQFGLSLDQSLVVAVEDEARWMIANNLTPEKQVPDFLKYIHEDTLKATRPEAVNIIR